MPESLAVLTEDRIGFIIESGMTAKYKPVLWGFALRVTAQHYNAVSILISAMGMTLLVLAP